MDPKQNLSEVTPTYGATNHSFSFVWRIYHLTILCRYEQGPEVKDSIAEICRYTTLDNFCCDFIKTSPVGIYPWVKGP